MADDVPYTHHPKSNRHQHNGSEIGGTFLNIDSYALSVGDIDGGNYTEFESDGTMAARGNAICWDDLRFPATRVRQGALNKPDFDYTDLGLLFPQNDATEVASIIAQMPHEWATETSIHPHIHFIQPTSGVPVFKIDYRVTENGGTPGAFTTLSTADGNGYAFTGTSGGDLQFMDFPAIPMAGVDSVSAIIDIKLYRDDNVVTGDVLLKEFDIHYQIDTLGSRAEYSK